MRTVHINPISPARFSAFFLVIHNGKVTVVSGIGEGYITGLGLGDGEGLGDGLGLILGDGLGLVKVMDLDLHF